MIKISDLHKKWMKDPEYRKEYDALEEEFSLIIAIAKARMRAGGSSFGLERTVPFTAGEQGFVGSASHSITATAGPSAASIAASLRSATARCSFSMRAFRSASSATDLS